LPLSTMNHTWAGSGSKPMPLSREAINVTLARPWSHLWNRLWKGEFEITYLKIEYSGTCLEHRIILPENLAGVPLNKYTNLVKYISHTLIFQSKSCNVGPETAHFSCNKAFCMSPCRTARHSVIISWWSVSSSGTLAIICKYSFKN
jgi:hypothetical protein